MIRIAIVDDEKDHIIQLNQIILTFFKNKNIQITVDTFLSGELLLSDTTVFDLIFLDIQMDGIDGIETAQQLRVKNKKTAFFYVTSYKDYIQKSMTIHPFAFIVKPYSEKEIIENLEDYIVYNESLNIKSLADVYHINTVNNLHFSINTRDILYFHYLENRNIQVITKNERHTIKDSISNVFSQLNHDCFIIPNQSFIINIYNVKEINGYSKSIIMKNDDIILISRRKYNEILEIFNLFISDQGE